MRKCEDGSTHISMEGIAIEIPSLKELDTLASLLRPRIPVGQGSIKRECNDTGSQECHDTSPSNSRSVPNAKWTSNPVGREVIDLAHRNDGKVQSRKVMMEEQLALHQVEWEVMEGPAQNRSTDLVVEAFEVDIVVVVEPPLPAENRETFEDRVYTNGSSG